LERSSIILIRDEGSSPQLPQVTSLGKKKEFAPLLQVWLDLSCDRIAASLDTIRIEAESMTNSPRLVGPRQTHCRLSLATMGFALLTMAAFSPVPCTARRAVTASRKDGGIAARWDFTAAAQGFALEQVSRSHDPIEGRSRPADSPVGPALQMDGYTTLIRHTSLKTLAREDDFSISCWLQVEAYPWNELPILDQAGPDRAVFFGLDAEGHLVASLTSKREVRKFTTVDSLPLRQWVLVALTVTRDRQVTFYLSSRSIDARESSAVPFFELAANQQSDILIGHVRKPLVPAPPSFVHPKTPVEYSLQGSLAELTVYDHALPAEEVSALAVAGSGPLLERAPWPAFPRVPAGSGAFGAFYTTLRFDPMWDRTRRIAPDSDVVVRFPHAPIQLIFWQGMNYIPAWVTENNRWYTDEFVEVYGHPRCPEGGDCEPMSDKQERYSHVRILESTPARAVIHWRYALSEAEHYEIADAPTPTAWGDWADEYWTVYPDGVAIRRQVLWSTAAQRDQAEFQESIVLIPAGETPEDNVHFDALCFANLQGDVHAYSWQPKTGKGLSLPKGPGPFTEPPNAVIQWVNLKSTWKPFQVAWGSPVKFDAYNGEPSISSFEWWNHWPVAQIPSSGRPALAADRPGHTSLSHIYWPISEQDDRHIEKTLMDGLTTLKAAQLAPLAASWRTPAPAVVSSGVTIHYDAAQRAYILSGAMPKILSITLHGSRRSPVVDPAFVLPGWSGKASVSVESAHLDTPVETRLGYVEELEQTKLIAFLSITSDHDVTITIHSDR
jgi:Concanavalin A-like lectin/glucanases superfamily